MSGIAIASPVPVTAITASRGGGAVRLLTADPREAWFDSLVGAPVTFTIDLGSVQSIDCIFVGFTNATRDASWSITGGRLAANEVPLLDVQTFAVGNNAVGNNASRVHGLALLDEAVPVRFLAVTITQPIGASPLYAGILLAAALFQPAMGQEWGAGRGVVDLAQRSRLNGGGFGGGEGIVKANWQATLGDLSDGEVDTLWAIARDRGEHLPLLVIERVSRDAGLADRMHWCVFDRIEPYERRSPGRTRWSLKFEDWL